MDLIKTAKILEATFENLVNYGHTGALKQCAYYTEYTVKHVLFIFAVLRFLKMAVTWFTLLTLTLISIFTTFVPVVQGCFCAPEHPQATYCKADFGKSAVNNSFDLKYDELFTLHVAFVSWRL